MARQACYCDDPNCWKCKVRKGEPSGCNQRYWWKWQINLDRITIDCSGIVATKMTPSNQAQQATKQAQSPRKRQPRIALGLTCANLGDIISRTSTCGKPTKNEDMWLRECKVHLACSLNAVRKEARMVCSGCSTEDGYVPKTIQDQSSNTSNITS